MQMTTYGVNADFAMSLTKFAFCCGQLPAAPPSGQSACAILALQGA
jgi:hypothetical protein